MSGEGPLPPGQFETSAFVRFGLGRFRDHSGPLGRVEDIAVRGDLAENVVVGGGFSALPRQSLRADFHCVTGWSRRGLLWEGVRFCDFYEDLVRPRARPAEDVRLVVLRGADGYASSLPLQDLLQPDILLADTLDGTPLGRDHGAPLRLVAPPHYGYKNVKHLVAVEFWRDARNYRFPFPYPPFIDHPRARVAEEERGVGIPAGMLRAVYGLMIPRAIRKARLR